MPRIEITTIRAENEDSNAPKRRNEGGIAGVEIDASDNTTCAASENKLAKLEVSEDQVIADSTMPLWATATAPVASVSAGEDNRHLVDLSSSSSS